MPGLAAAAFFSFLVIGSPLKGSSGVSMSTFVLLKQVNWRTKMSCPPWCRVIHLEVCAGCKSERGSRGRFSTETITSKSNCFCTWVTDCLCCTVTASALDSLRSCDIVVYLPKRDKELSSHETQVQQTDLELRTRPTRWKEERWKGRSSMNSACCRWSANKAEVEWALRKHAQSISSKTKHPGTLSCGIVV